MGYSQQSDEPLRKWYPTLPVIPDVEQRWFTQDEIGQIVNQVEGIRVCGRLAVTHTFLIRSKGKL